jgi:K+-sensing histidine kinase KdpD
VVYGLLTAILGTSYALIVLGLGQLAGALGRGTHSLAVAVATLAVAVLAGPLRRRVQETVDRRFNRRRYDAAQTIAAFSGRLRQELDLDALARELLAVVDQTMEPTRLSLWVRPTRNIRPGQARSAHSADQDSSDQRQRRQGRATTP